MIKKYGLRASALVVLALGVVGCASSGNEVLKS
jgi:hypothetical protein